MTFRSGSGRRREEQQKGEGRREDGRTDGGGTEREAEEKTKEKKARCKKIRKGGGNILSKNTIPNGSSQLLSPRRQCTIGDL